MLVESPLQRAPLKMSSFYATLPFDILLPFEPSMVYIFLLVCQTFPTLHFNDINIKLYGIKIKAQLLPVILQVVAFLVHSNLSNDLE